MSWTTTRFVLLAWSVKHAEAGLKEKSTAEIWAWIDVSPINQIKLRRQKVSSSYYFATEPDATYTFYFSSFHQPNKINQCYWKYFKLSFYFYVRNCPKSQQKLSVGSLKLRCKKITFEFYKFAQGVRILLMVIFSHQLFLMSLTNNIKVIFRRAWNSWLIYITEAVSEAHCKYIGWVSPALMLIKGECMDSISRHQLKTPTRLGSGRGNNSTCYTINPILLINRLWVLLRFLCLSLAPLAGCSGRCPSVCSRLLSLPLPLPHHRCLPSGPCYRVHWLISLP